MPRNHPPSFGSLALIPTSSILLCGLCLLGATLGRFFSIDWMVHNSSKDSGARKRKACAMSEWASILRDPLLSSKAVGEA